MLSEFLKRYQTRCREASEAKEYSKVTRISEEMTRELRATPPSSDEVLALLRVIPEQPRYELASSVMVSAWFQLSQDYVPVLCEIVLDTRCNSWHEQAIELLDELRDPASVPALVAAIEYRWGYDPWYSVPRKALQALAVIETPEAIAAIQSATTSDVDLIRQEAIDMLTN
ncbi:HEAT repeat domain-containing protein [Bremerella cremea]|uniref:HEAT repeat domain-containing protein n=1 Tax=Bremerella cremea TaxID=1031537 RepID=UPI0031F04F99